MTQLHWKLVVYDQVVKVNFLDVLTTFFTQLLMDKRVYYKSL